MQKERTLRQAPVRKSPTGEVVSDQLTANSSSQYTIGVADVLRVNVWKNADLSQTVTVDPDGFVSLPLLGNVNVAGLSTDQLGTLLTGKYASYVVTPQVTVSVVDIRSRAVFVMGQVGKAGSYPLLAPTTVLQLIAQAGGLTPFAKRKNIYVLRASMGQSEKIPFNYVKVSPRRHACEYRAPARRHGHRSIGAGDEQKPKDRNTAVDPLFRNRLDRSANDVPVRLAISRQRPQPEKRIHSRPEQMRPRSINRRNRRMKLRCPRTKMRHRSTYPPSTGQG